MDDVSRRAAWITAMCAVQKETDLVADMVASIPNRGEYLYMGLCSLLRAVQPALNNHGLAIWWSSDIGQNDRLHVTCYVGHKEGHVEACTVAMPQQWQGRSRNGQELRGSPATQGLGAALTYLKRYSLLEALGLEVDKDNDLNDPSQVQPRAAAAPSPPPPAQPAPARKVQEATSDELVDRETLQNLRRIAKRCKPETMNQVLADVQQTYGIPIQELTMSEASIVHGWFQEALANDVG